MPINDNIPGVWPKDPVCRHGRPECECLDDELSVTFPAASVTINGHWHEVGTDLTNIMTGGSAGGTTIGGIGGTSAPIIQGTAAPNIPQTGTGLTSFPNGTITFPNATVTQPVFGCETVGHRVIDRPIITDDDGALVGICVDCQQTVRFPGGMKAFDFEQAGILLGRAISIDSEDDTSAGVMLGELAALEAEIDRQVRRFEAAKELLALARGSVTKRALRDAASSVDAI